VAGVTPAAPTTAPFWWEAAPPQDRDGPLPAKVEVAIVGGGYTGLSAALTLARAGRQVAVLDAQRPGEGASSRNGGMIGSGHRVGFAAASEKYGPAVARRLLQEGNNALAYTTALIEREKIACHFVRSGRFRGAWNAQHYAAMERELDTLRREIGLEATMVPKAQVPQEVATPHYHGGCIFHLHGGLHPALFHLGLMERVETAGAKVFGSAAVQSIESHGGRHRLTTPRGGLEAGEVIVATNGYTRPGTPFFSRRVVPAASYLVATEELGENRVRALIPGGRMIVETRARHCYYRASPDGRRLLLGARPALRNLDPRRTLPTMRRLLEHLFPELKGVGLSHAWSGLVGMSRDSLPHLGRHEGLWYALGYSGSGVAMAPYLGHKVALRLLGDPEGRTPFEETPFPSVPFFSGQSWFLAPLELWYRVKDWREGSP
jgi:glycine/D-amino acid oxidase-like deaminating enzyme